MNDSEYQKRLLLQRIETNRELLRRDLRDVTGMLRPWRRAVALGRDAAPHLRTLASGLGSMARSTGGWKRLAWALPVAVPALLWLVGGARRRSDGS